ncbi:probable zinc phosphodiesterase ELAC protein 2 at C-terminar half [Coccomyxa sp. Obi]|nr:probable zinc phosphodiesterase ELAC protein 2 at C-terminar half [Coccomyxa sp. Obi]
MSSSTLHLCSAAGDGIEPAALLTLGEDGPQYLFNAPEGYARLALEHKIRPSAKLQALFALHPQAMGGLSGLIMRLREDGHNTMHVIGPQGTVSLVHSLRHFMRWKYPGVIITEMLPSRQDPHFEDGHVAVLALHASPAGWQASDWLTKLGSNPPLPQAAPQTLPSSQEVRSGVGAPGNHGGNGVESISGDSTSDEDDAGEARMRTAKTAASDGEVRMRIAKTAAKLGEASEEEPVLPADVREVAFQQLDEALLSNWQKQTILKVLKKQQPKLATAQSEASMQQPQEQRDKKTSAMKVSSPKQAGQSRTTRRPAAKTGRASGEGMQWVINTLEEGGNPVHVRRRKPIPLGPNRVQHPAALLCYMKAVDRVLLVVDSPGPAQRRDLSLHPAIHLLRSSSRFVDTLHLSAAASARTSAYMDWAKSLPGQQILACEAKAGDGPELGHLASARNLAKLNAVSAAVFPLPPAMTVSSSEEICIPDEPDSPVTSVSGAEDTVGEVAVSAEDAGSKHLLQIRVQSSIDAGEVQKELLSSRPALQQLRDSLKASPLSKPFTNQTCQPSSPAPSNQGGVQHADLAQPQQGLPPIFVEDPLHAGAVRPVSDLSFMGPAAACNIHLQAALLMRPPAALTGGLRGGSPAIWTPQIPPQPPPGPRVLAPPPHGGLLMPRPQPPHGFMQRPAPPHPIPGRQMHRPMPLRPGRAMPVSRPGASSWGPQELQQGPWQPQMREPRLLEPPITGARTNGSPAVPAKRHKSGKQHAPAHAKRRDVLMKEADAKGQASNKGAAVALRMKLHDHPGAQERTEMDASPVPDQADPSTLDMPVDEQRSQSADGTYQGRLADAEPSAPEILGHEPQVMQQQGSAGAMNRQVDCIDATDQCLEEQSEVLGCMSVDPTPPDALMKEALEDQQGQPGSSDGALAAAALPAEPMELALSDNVTAEQSCMDTTAWHQKLASATEPQPTSTPEEPVSAAADVDSSGQPMHSSVADVEASPAMKAAPQAQLLLTNKAEPGGPQGAQEQPSMGGSEAAQKEALVARSAAPIRKGGPGAEQPRQNEEAADDVNSIIKNAIAKAFGTNVSPQKRKADEMQEQPLEKESCPVEKKRLVTDSIAAFFKGIKEDSEHQQLDSQGAAAVQANGREPLPGQGVNVSQQPENMRVDLPQQAVTEPEKMAVQPKHAQTAAKAAAKNVPKLIVASPTRSPTTPQCIKAMAAQKDASQVLFLGTGCAEPSAYRGGSALHVRLRNGHGLLLDAGEGALGQLVRHYGPAGATKQVDSLCAVWISHKHADHMLGLPGILQARSASSPPLLVIGPSAAHKWLAEARQALQLRYHFMHCRDFDAHGGPARQWLMNMTGLLSWQSVPVEHCADAFGLVIRHESGWSMVYSGDSRPCRRLQEAGRGCTLLVHEATFEPALHFQARQKRHSTTEEALRVAARMGAYRIILTHFSSRYPKVPVGLPTFGPLSEMVASACDGMRVPLVLLPELPKLMPAIMAALGDDPAADTHP